MLITPIKHEFVKELTQIDHFIKNNLVSKIKLIEQIGAHIIGSGGKRLRPLLVLLCARACGYFGEHGITMAAVIEFIHTATLLHDDVVDASLLRRGCETANCKWGNEVAVLVGDFLYSRAFQLMVQVDNSDVMAIMAEATNKIAEGEVLQLSHQRNAATTEADYLEIIRYKTGQLFAAAAEVGGAIAGCDASLRGDLAAYGLHLGTAYQLIDDVLDYEAQDVQFGKLLGNDLEQGKLTLPIIYLLRHGTAQQRELVMTALTQRDEALLVELRCVVRNSPALEYTRQFAQSEATLAQQALFALPQSRYRDLALELAHFAVERTH